MTTTKRKIATALVFLVIALLCATLTAAAVLNISDARTAYADDGATESTSDEAEISASVSYKLYIVIGIAALLLIVIIAVAAVTNKKYCLSFVVGRQALAPSARKLPAGTDIGRLPIPKRNGARFAGWYADVYLSRPFTATKMPAKDTTVYAKWKHGLYR